MNNESLQKEALQNLHHNSLSVEGTLQAFDDDVKKSGCSTEPDIYYDIHRKEYLIQNKEGSWMNQSEMQIRRRLRSMGYSSKTVDGEMISPLDSRLIEITDNDFVSYAGPLAERKGGFCQEGKVRLLITESPDLILPQETDWPTLKEIFEPVLKDEKCDQLTYFYGWLKVAVTALFNGKRTFGQALVIAGPAGCGKSLIQSIITMILGGRSARPFPYMTGKTDFNADLFSAEHLMIEDEAPCTDFRSRKNLGNAIKQITVNEEQRMHAKRRDAITMKPFWRLTISLNEEPEDISVLPPIDSGVEDKIILLKGHKRQLPVMDGSLEAKEQFTNKIRNELPGFIYYLLNGFSIPPELICERFGITHIHHPDLLKSLNELSKEQTLLDFIDQIVPLPFQGRASELEDTLMKSDQMKANSLFYFPNACGKCLERLAKQHPERVIKRRKESHNEWEIRPK